MGNKLKLSAVITAGLILAGCAATGEKSVTSGPSTETNRPNAVQDIKTYTAQVGLTPRQRFTKALEKLDNGEDGQALAELKEYLKEVPGSNSAKNLVEQISTDPSKYFPAEFFKVNLNSGNSLSTLAKKYLGSALKFYALAKYNDISNPSRVNIGQEIKIPLTQLARSVRDKDQSKATKISEDKNEVSVADTETVVDSVEELAAEESQPAVTEEVIPKTVKVIPMAAEVTAKSVLNELQMSVNKNDYATAIEKVSALKKFGELDKEARDLSLSAFIDRAKQIENTDKVLAAKYYSEAGQLNLLKGDSFAAFENFKLATDLDENNEQAMEDMLVLQKEIADKYHKEASSAFRRQELDLAIAKWDKVLAVNPEHSSAKLYRAQAIELKERLEKIKKN